MWCMNASTNHPEAIGEFLVPIAKVKKVYMPPVLGWIRPMYFCSCLNVEKI